MSVQPATAWVSTGCSGNFAWGPALRRNEAGDIEFQDACRPGELVFVFGQRLVAGFFAEVRAGVRDSFAGIIRVKRVGDELWLFDARRGNLYLDFPERLMVQFFRAVADGRFDHLLQAPVTRACSGELASV